MPRGAAEVIFEEVYPVPESPGGGGRSKAAPNEDEENNVETAATFDADDPGDVALKGMSERPLIFIPFVVASLLLALAEPVLVAYDDGISSTSPSVQLIVLGASSVLFVIGFIWTMSLVEPPPAASTVGRLVYRMRFATLGETWIEIICFAIGWAFIQDIPGLAALRCFRVFRFVWYAELYEADKGAGFLYILMHFSHLITSYLESIGNEIFSVSSKGGVIILTFYFYLTYVFGLTFWLITNTMALTSPEGGATGVLSECDTIAHCFIIMMRLSLYDGDGFDYLKSLSDAGQGGLVALLILYMCISAFVLLNIMIGIFGQSFQSSREEADSLEELEAKEEQELKEKEELLQELRDIKGLLLQLTGGDGVTGVHPMPAMLSKFE